jgi:hypothetical protein
MKGYPRALSRAPVGTELFIKRFRYPIVNKTITVTAAGAAVGFGSVVIGALPQGNVLAFGGGGYLSLLTADADIAAAWNGDASVGTAATADVTLSALEINLLPSNAIGPAVAKLAAGAVGRVFGKPVSQPESSIDNTANDQNVVLNFLVDAADIVDAAAADFTVNGYIDLFLAVVGDD